MQELLDKGVKVYASCAGAGVSFVHDLWATPGASAYFLGASLPYAKEETDRVLGYTPDKYVSEDTALGLAVASYLRAARHPGRPVGVGLTATIAGTRVHKGDHVIHAAALGPDIGSMSTTILTKRVGDEERRHDERLSSLLARGRLLEAAGIREPYCERSDVLLPHVLSRPMFCRDGRRAPDFLVGAPLFLSGNFNPIHVGHRGMAQAVAAKTGKRVVYELSLAPPHKDRIAPAEALRRVALVDRDILLTECPLYIDKARRFPGCGFIVGADAMARMLDPKWGPIVDEMCDEFRRLGTTFYVFKRAGTSWPLGGSRGIFVEMPGRWDVSSTELRNGRR